MIMWWVECCGRGKALAILHIAACAIEDGQREEGSPHTLYLRHLLPMLPILHAAVEAGPERQVGGVRTPASLITSSMSSHLRFLQTVSYDFGHTSTIQC